jgi:predicted deacylase
MIKTVTYVATEPGPALLITGAVHGNEKCGTVAINQALADIDGGKLSITRGKVTFVPICNPRAYEEDKRYIERNLNRYLVPMEKPDTYEAKLGNILCPIFADCEALLDIHSYTIGGEPFISYEGRNEKERAFAAALGAPTVLTGWVEVYNAMGRGREISKEESTGGPQYARRHGAIAVTLECGQHNDSKAPKVAYQGILNALRHFNMVEGAKAATATPPPPRHITLTHIYYRDNHGEFPRSWKNFEPVKNGEVIAKYPDDKNITATSDGFIVMPKPGCPVGEEWFYFGVERPPDAP